jgi:hypothetical protein
MNEPDGPEEREAEMLENASQCAWDDYFEQARQEEAFERQWVEETL